MCIILKWIYSSIGFIMLKYLISERRSIDAYLQIFYR